MANIFENQLGMSSQTIFESACNHEVEMKQFFMKVGLQSQCQDITRDDVFALLHDGLRTGTGQKLV